MGPGQRNSKYQSRPRCTGRRGELIPRAHPALTRYGLRLRGLAGGRTHGRAQWEAQPGRSPEGATGSLPQTHPALGRYRLGLRGPSFLGAPPQQGRSLVLSMPCECSLQGSTQAPLPRARCHTPTQTCPSTQIARRLRVVCWWRWVAVGGRLQNARTHVILSGTPFWARHIAPGFGRKGGSVGT